MTLFTRQNCRLCDQAKAVLSDVQNRRPFAYREIDLADPSSGAWRELYDFDIPVVCSLPLASQHPFPLAAFIPSRQMAMHREEEKEEKGIGNWIRPPDMDNTDSYQQGRGRRGAGQHGR